MGGQNPVFGCKKEIFSGSAQNCTESLDFDLNLSSSGWVAKLKFLGFKKQIYFPRIGPKVPRIDKFGHKFWQFWEDDQNPVFWYKKQIFPGSAQKCSESIDFDINFANSGRVAKIQFLYTKRRFPRICPKVSRIDRF